MADKSIAINTHELSQELKAKIAELKDTPAADDKGIVTTVSDGIAWIYGLKQAGFNEVVKIRANDGSYAESFVLQLGEDEVGAVLLGDDRLISAGAEAELTGTSLEIPVGEELVGRVIDPLGRPLDEQGELKAAQTAPIERRAPEVMDRKSVHEPLMTGITAIDAMIPIGRGQRELIIGDRQTGKTAVAIDTMINQHQQNTGVINIYVAIGQKIATVARLVERLRREGVMDQTVVVATSAADPASLQYLAPYVGCAIGEYFRDNGGHALIIYDDLSKHAVAYRQMSLLLRRPPGREAYPGDVFYLHSRLLERAAKLNDELGGGSLTALPIIETQAGDVSAYIPTNVISITDGQIYLQSSLFNEGQRPAVNVGLSVSRVGGDAQTKAIKKVAGSLRLDLAQFRELEAFAQFSSDLDPQTKARITRGQHLTELLKQPQYSPRSLAEQVTTLMVGTDGVFDPIPLTNVAAAQQELMVRLEAEQPEIVKRLDNGQQLEDDQKQLVLGIGREVAVAMREEPAS